MNVPERVEELKVGLRAVGVLGSDEQLAFVALLCNGCNLLVASHGPDMVADLERQADGWRLGGIHEEADFCPSCVALALANSVR